MLLGSDEDEATTTTTTTITTTTTAQPTSASCVLQEIWLNNSDYVRVYGLNDYASCQTNCLQRTTTACVAWTFWTALLGISKKEGKYFF